MLAARPIALVALIGASLAIGLGARGQQAAPASRAPVRVPVLVELFTSEGCSSCPPADGLLKDLLATQPVDGAFVVGLSEHVDYWNRLGWTDPFSDATFSARQSAYAATARSGEVYTPQMVIDGAASFVGSDRTRAITAITAAATRTKAGIDLRWDDAGDSPARDMLDVHIAGGVVKANTPVWVAIAEDGLTVRVTRGENTDRALTHDGVTRHLSQAGRTDKAGAFRKLVPVRLAGSWRASATRITVFTQQAGGPVTALGMIGASDRARGSAQARR